MHATPTPETRTCTDDALVRRIAECVVAGAQPLRVILFGSRVQGTA